MTDAPTPLRDPAFLQALFDLAIPPSEDGRMPGAGSLEIKAEVAAAIEGDPMLGALAGAGLGALREAALARDPGGLAGLPPAGRLEVLEAVIASQPMLMFALGRHLYPAYYQHPRVLEALGEPPRPPFPEGFEIEPTDEELLAGLQERARSR